MYSKPLEKLKMTNHQAILEISHQQSSLEISNQQSGKKKRVYSQIPRMALPPISRCPFL
jgi:hypothetical protein